MNVIYFKNYDDNHETSDKSVARLFVKKNQKRFKWLKGRKIETMEINASP